MRRPEAGEYAPYYDGYIKLTRGTDFLQNMEDSADELVHLLENIPPEKRQYAYAEGKWTVEQMLQHIIDCDLVFSFRALWLVRSGGGNLEGFEQDEWARTTQKSQRNWDEMLTEFKRLRDFSISMFHSFDEKGLEIKGTVSGNNTTVRRLGFIMAGHTFHHIHILRTKYL